MQQCFAGRRRRGEKAFETKEHGEMGEAKSNGRERERERDRGGGNVRAEEATMQKAAAAMTDWFSDDQLYSFVPLISLAL